MLLLGSRRATYVPLIYLLVGGIITAVSIAALASDKTEAVSGSLMGFLLGALSLYFAVSACRTITLSDDNLVVRGLRKLRSLERSACAFGVRLKTGRSPAYVVFVTDSVASEEIGEWSSESAARSAVSRLETLCRPDGTSFVAGPAQQNPRLERARRQVEKLESAWKAEIAPAQKAIADYYRSKSWRITKYAVLGGLVVYVLATSLYFYLTGQ